MTKTFKRNGDTDDKLQLKLPCLRTNEKNREILKRCFSYMMVDGETKLTLQNVSQLLHPKNLWFFMKETKAVKIAFLFSRKHFRNSEEARSPARFLITLYHERQTRAIVPSQLFVFAITEIINKYDLIVPLSVRGSRYRCTSEQTLCSKRLDERRALSEIYSLTENGISGKEKLHRFI